MVFCVHNVRALCLVRESVLFIGTQFSILYTFIGTQFSILYTILYTTQCASTVSCVHNVWVLFNVQLTTTNSTHCVFCTQCTSFVQLTTTNPTQTGDHVCTSFVQLTTTNPTQTEIMLILRVAFFCTQCTSFVLLYTKYEFCSFVHNGRVLFS